MIYDKDKLVGRMRFDFYEGDSSLSNKWIPATEINDEEVKEITVKVNDIMFNRFNHYNKIVEKCGGEGYDKERIIEEETDNFYYAIKLIPVKVVYNGYIFVYRK